MLFAVGEQTGLATGMVARPRGAQRKTATGMPVAVKRPSAPTAESRYRAGSWPIFQGPFKALPVRIAQ